MCKQILKFFSNCIKSSRYAQIALCLMREKININFLGASVIRALPKQMVATLFQNFTYIIGNSRPIVINKQLKCDHFEPLFAFELFVSV